jgi:hypothetical protein
MSEQGKDVKVEVVAQPVQEVHPLLLKKVSPIINWHDWLKLWESAGSFQMMESLLHCGFDISLHSWWGQGQPEPEYVEDDRLLFYLSVAEGCVGSSLSFEIPKESGIQYEVGYDERGYTVRKYPYQIRQQLATKAFDVLCSNFFKKVELMGGGRHGDHLNDRWRLLVDSDRLFGAIQKFFRVDPGYRGEGSICNLRTGDEERWSQRERQTVTFLLNLATFLWEWREETFSSKPDPVVVECDAKTRAVIDAAKPWMVEVLVCLRKISLLHKHILEIDEACLAKLKEIALRAQFSHYSHPVSDDRMVKTVDEACYVGSTAALFLEIYEVRNRVHRQLNEVWESERVVEAEQYRLSEIRAAEEAVTEAARKVEELKRAETKK